MIITMIIGFHIPLHQQIHVMAKRCDNGHVTTGDTDASPVLSTNHTGMITYRSGKSPVRDGARRAWRAIPYDAASLLGKIHGSRSRGVEIGPSPRPTLTFSD